MGAKKKPSKKGGKKMGYMMTLIAGLFLALPMAAHAEGFSFLDKPLTLKYMPTAHMATDNINNRGGGVMGTIGPIAAYTVGENQFVSLEISMGIAVMPDAVSTDTQNTDGSFGIGPCWLNRTLCTHWGKRVDTATGDMTTEFKVGFDVLPYLRTAAGTVGL